MSKRSLFGEQGEMFELDEVKTSSGKDGYYARDYAAGNLGPPKSDSQMFIRRYMERIYLRHSINYFIPTSNIRRYYAGAKRIMKLLGGLQEGLAYVDWYINAGEFQKTGYSLDLMMSSSVCNKFMSLDSKDRKKDMPKGFVTSETRNTTKGTVI